MEVLTKDIYGKVKTEHDVSTFKADAAAMGDVCQSIGHCWSSYGSVLFTPPPPAPDPCARAVDEHCH